MRDDIPSSAKLLYGVLSTFKSFEEEGVWASRKVLAKRIACQPQRITELLKMLKDADLVFFNGNKYFSEKSKIRLIKKIPHKPSDLGGYRKRLRGAKSKDLPSNNNIIDNIHTPQKGGCGILSFIPKDSNIRPSYFRFADQIQKKQIQNHPSKYKQYSKQQLEKQIISSGNTIDQLVRLDKWDFCKDVKPVIEWAIGDDFWTYQVRSLSRLRARMKNGETKFTNIHDGWEQNKNNKTKAARAKAKKNEDSRNPARKTLRPDKNGVMQWVWPEEV
jgi:hypothetical protein